MKKSEKSTEKKTEKSTKKKSEKSTKKKSEKKTEKSTKQKTKQKTKKKTKKSNINDRLEYLVHTVSLDKFKNILETKKIKSTPDPLDHDEYFEKLNNGPITQAIFDWNINETPDTKRLHGLTLVLSKKILEKYKYQISNKHGGKRFSPITEGETQSDFRIYNNINDFIDKEENNQKIHFENEVIFKTGIPIEFLKEIWVCDTLFIYNKYKLYKPGEVQKNTNKLFDNVIKLLETHGINIPVKIIDTIPKFD